MTVLVANHPLLSDPSKVLGSSDHSQHTFEMTKLHLAFFIGGKLMLTVEICGRSIHKPLVHDLYREVYIGSHLTVLPVHRQIILTLLFLQEDVAHV